MGQKLIVATQLEREANWSWKVLDDDEALEYISDWKLMNWSFSCLSVKSAF